jgi:hypothetical protein
MRPEVSMTNKPDVRGEFGEHSGCPRIIRGPGIRSACGAFHYACYDCGVETTAGTPNGPAYSGPYDDKHRCGNCDRAEKQRRREAAQAELSSLRARVEAQANTINECLTVLRALDTRQLEEDTQAGYPTLEVAAFTSLKRKGLL